MSGKADLIVALAELSSNKNLRATVSGSAKGAAVCGTSCFIGGILGGPVGLAVGGTIGGLIAYSMNDGNFRPVADILLNDLTSDQREKLVIKVMSAVKHIGVFEAAHLGSMLLTNKSLQDAALNAVKSFLNSELSCRMIQ